MNFNPKPPLAALGYTYFFVSNPQGDILKVVDYLGNDIVTYEYDPWGKVINEEIAPGKQLIAERNIFRYRGYIYDSETELYYLQSRYYDPHIGRFVNADGLVSTGQGVLGNNMYAYCLNNPVIHVDYTGTCTAYSPCHYAVIFDIVSYNATWEEMSSCPYYTGPAENPRPTPPPPPPIPPGGETVYKGQPRICTDGSDGSKVKDDHWQPYTALSKWTDTAITTLDAYTMPYVVMPGAGSANKGDLAILVNWDTGQSISCIVGDVGPAKNGWGEVSIAAIWATGHPDHMTANHASGISSNYEIILYPGVSFGYDWSYGNRKVKR